MDEMKDAVISYDGYNMAVNEKVFMTITSGATDDHHIPSVIYSIKGNVVDRASAQNCKGLCETICFQLCGDRDNPSVSTSEKAYCIPANPMSDRGQAVVYSVDALSSNSMKSNNPHSGFHETDVVKCLDTQCLYPICNQGGVLIVSERRT